jgi:polygalacturonase
VSSDPAAASLGLTSDCDPRAFGAKGDGLTKDTAALQAAIDSCQAGGTVILRDGTFLSGTVRLKSDLTLHIDPTATLKGTQDDADYPDINPPFQNTQLSNCKRALVYAENVKNVRVEGGGTIDGSGTAAQWRNVPEKTRPMAVFTTLSSNLTYENITIKDSAMWSLVNMEGDGLTIRNVHIDSQVGNTRDGIDVVDFHDVLIEDCTIETEDDSICLKSGSRRGVENVTVKNSHVARSIVANGLKFGTASYGSLRHVLFQNILVENTDKAAMAIESVDGADISDVTFQNIQFHQVGTPFFVLLGDRGGTPKGDVHKLGSIDGVRFEHVTGDGVKYDWASPISGTTLADGTQMRLRNISFDDVHVKYKGGLTRMPADPPEYHGQYPDPNLWGNLPAWGYFIRHADGMTFTNSTALVDASDVRTELVSLDVTGLDAP